jgi:hypothetical protein
MVQVIGAKFYGREGGFESPSDMVEMAIYM